MTDLAPVVRLACARRKLSGPEFERRRDQGTDPLENEDVATHPGHDQGQRRYRCERLVWRPLSEADSVDNYGAVRAI